MTQINLDNWLEQRPLETADQSLEARIAAQAQVTPQQATDSRWKWARPLYGVMGLALVGIFLSVAQPQTTQVTDVSVSDSELITEVFYYDDDTLF